MRKSYDYSKMIIEYLEPRINHQVVGEMNQSTVS